MSNVTLLVQNIDGKNKAIENLAISDIVNRGNFHLFDKAYKIVSEERIFCGFLIDFS